MPISKVRLILNTFSQNLIKKIRKVQVEIYLRPQAEYKRESQCPFSRTQASLQRAVMKSTLNSTKIQQRILSLTPSSTKTDRRKTNGRGHIVICNFLLHIGSAIISSGQPIRILRHLSSYCLP